MDIGRQEILAAAASQHYPHDTSSADDAAHANATGLDEDCRTCVGVTGADRYARLAELGRTWLAQDGLSSYQREQAKTIAAFSEMLFRVGFPADCEVGALNLIVWDLCRQLGKCRCTIGAGNEKTMCTRQ